MKIREYMSSDVVCANVNDGLRQTFYRMLERRIRHMPVLGHRQELVGVISDRDLRRPDWVDAEENVAHYFVLDNEVKVDEAMSRNVATVSPDDPIQVAVDLLLEHRYGALPVVEGKKRDRVVGIISAIDLIRVLRDKLAGS